MKPLLPIADEQLRLETLRQYHLLDTLPEQVLDDLTALAAGICNTPISLISLVDEKRQWFKSNVGLPATETPREISFCARTILQRDLLLVPDTAKDDRFAENPLVTDSKIRFYAGAPLITPNGQAIGTLCVIDQVPRELTPLQQEALRVLSRQVMAQLELRRQMHESAESESRLRLALEAAQMGTFDWDIPQKRIAWSRGHEELWGFRPGEFNGTYEAFAGRVHPEDLPGLEAEIARCTTAQVPFQQEFRVLWPDGTVHWVMGRGESTFDEKGQPTRMRGVVRETTERREISESLAVKTETLAAITESLAAYVERQDWRGAMGRLVRCALSQTNSEYGFIGVVMGESSLRVLAHEGIQWDKVVNREFYENALRHYEKEGYLEFTSFDNLFGRAITTGQVITSNRPDGDPRSKGRPAGHPPMHSFMGVPIFAGQQVHGLVALANRPGGYSEEEQHRIEVLVRHAGGLCTSYLHHLATLASEVEMRRRDERFRLLIENAADLIGVIDHQGVIGFQSPSTKQLLGYQPEEMAGRSAFEFIHPDDAPQFKAVLEKAIANPGLMVNVECRLRRQDGQWRIMQTIGRNISDPKEGGIIILNSRDVTESHQLERQFRQSQKMEAIGQLAGGVAHDFNNVLAIIMMQAELSATIENLPAEALEGLREILQAAEKASNLTRQLLLFSRRQVMQTRDLDLNEVVTSLVKMLQRLIGEDIGMQLLLHPSPLRIRADAGMLDQVLLNLAVNARDAMPSGGRLIIETAGKIVCDDSARFNPEQSPGRYAWLSVSDTGTGIPPEILPHVFDPFFTTKEPGKGTGLGLATVFGIIKQHGGWIKVYSEPNQGASFQIFLPINDSPSDQAPAPTASESAGGTETILVVEDEPGVRMLTRLVLERAGYQVLEAAHGADALKVWAQHSGEISLLLTDLVMPGGISGHQLARQLRGDKPGLKVVFSSGYSAEIAGREIDMRGGENFIQKPFPSAQLLQIVRRSLDDPGQTPAP